MLVGVAPDWNMKPLVHIWVDKEAETRQEAGPGYRPQGPPVTHFLQ